MADDLNTFFNSPPMTAKEEADHLIKVLKYIKVNAERLVSAHVHSSVQPEVNSKISFAVGSLDVALTALRSRLP